MTAKEIISKLEQDYELSYFQETLKDILDEDDYLGDEFSYAMIVASNFWREEYLSRILEKEFGKVSVVESELKLDGFAIIVLQFEGNIFLRIDFTLSSYEQPSIHSIRQVKPVTVTKIEYHDF